MKRREEAAAKREPPIEDLRPQRHRCERHAQDQKVGAPDSRSTLDTFSATERMERVHRCCLGIALIFSYSVSLLF